MSYVTSITFRPARQTRHWRGRKFCFRYYSGLAIGSTVTVYGIR